MAITKTIGHNTEVSFETLFGPCWGGLLGPYPIETTAAARASKLDFI